MASEIEKINNQSFRNGNIESLEFINQTSLFKPGISWDGFADSKNLNIRKKNPQLQKITEEQVTLNGVKGFEKNDLCWTWKSQKFKDFITFIQ